MCGEHCTNMNVFTLCSLNQMNREEQPHFFRWVMLLVWTLCIVFFISRQFNVTKSKMFMRPKISKLVDLHATKSVFISYEFLIEEAKL